MTVDPNRSRFYVVCFAAAVSGLFTAAIMALHVATEPIVAANERLGNEKAVVDLFGLGDVRTMTGEQVSDLIRRRVAGLADTDRPDEPRAKPIVLTDAKTGEAMQILAAYKTDLPAGRKPDIHDRPNLLGYAFRLRGVGFWAVIEGWLAVTPDGSRCLGVVFTRHQETPGLGGRITERRFRDQFRGLDISPPADGKEFIRVEAARPEKSSPMHKRHVDAITGATGTSVAVSKFVNEGIARFRRLAFEAGLIGPAPRRPATAPAGGP